MKFDLVALEQKAIDLQNNNKLQEAIEVFNEIIKINPNYEFGMMFYHLACCQEDLGEIKAAKESYLKAIEYNDEDDIRLGGYASFLYLHDAPDEAYAAHIKLFELEKNKKKDISDILITLKALKDRIAQPKHLVKLEQKAFYLQMNNNKQGAIKLFTEILSEKPSYEIGKIFLFLAECQDSIGEKNEAKENYVKSIEYEPEDGLRLSAYASFLFRNRYFSEAYDIYKKIFKLKKYRKQDVSEIFTIMNDLREKLNKQA